MTNHRIVVGAESIFALKDYVKETFSRVVTVDIASSAESKQPKLCITLSSYSRPVFYQSF